ncbi:SCP-2 sterol transfer family protein [Actinocrispum wychmicini]|uniref:SCP-2 sterol transfer family protein n=2 Tax=Actinocrispum wychmicini TaxID=1213861 RepID=A0A4R2JY19_9PSEU|nr:SCP-2 sterol transfer family protein [Actinocrispum wychmicini]
MPAALGGFDGFARSIDVTKLDEAQFVRLIETLDMLGKAGTGIELSALRTETFVGIIAMASAAQLDALMEHTDLRGVVLNEIFARMSKHLHSERAAGLDAVLHWRFTGGCENGGYDRYQTVIADGRCTSGIVQDRDPRATVTLAPTDFLRVSTGITAAPLLFLRGRIKVKGDIPFAAGFVNYFDIPRPEEP